MHDRERRPAFGTLAWALASGGNLTARERRSLLAPILRTTVSYTARASAHGARPAPRAHGDARSGEPALAGHEARARGRARVPRNPHAAMANHSRPDLRVRPRARRPRREPVDLEELYVASLLHDLALEAPTPGRCFAVVGAERARALRARRRRGARSSPHASPRGSRCTSRRGSASSAARWRR